MIYTKRILLSVLAAASFLGGVAGCSKSEKADSSNPAPAPPPTNNTPVKADVAFWLTNADKSVLFKKQNASLVFTTPNAQYATIEVDTTTAYQTIDGFGYTLTGGSATLINGLPADQKDALLQELFKSDSTHIGVSYLRISIGASDLSDATFTYDEVADGQTDASLNSFSINREKTDLIPILKKIISIAPNIKILGSPWTAPTWMKTNRSFKGGSLKPEYYAVYANYLVKYIQAMKAEGINIDAITPQNEPLNGDNNPSMVMQAGEQAVFIRDNLGPAFRSANVNTKIITYDHNADRPEYPIEVLNDAQARGFVDGSAFHLYGGDISALNIVHNRYPDKNIYFTEQWVGGPGNFSGDLQWHVENLIIGAPRNWSRNVLEWNLAADQNYRPYTNGGCSTCLGALTISGYNVTRNVSYYIIAHASKFVRPGSVRIASNVPANLPNVAFKNPDGKKVLVVLNKSTSPETFNIKFNGKATTVTINNGAVATFIW
ncbi:glycoside hydrolase family 30 protein [Mucilaginibacter lacusdianchii]|uniref:glycoside hydrolase family 30 protein n=1 Tax=Mucilaginibacter lacusdianchii TaxID=2684211 RepID=UPI00131CEEC3|nr:glycoside hydrolase family 30 beta sandwich domain-containing protein [Mucilaginibacter sp. JXJ CY 39]